MKFLLMTAMLVACCPEEFEEEDMSYKGWSASQNLEAASGNSFQLQANFSEPGPYTAQFTANYPAVWGINFSCVAQVDWKVEGNWVTRFINVANGTSISGTSQGVRIIVRDTSRRFVPGVTGEYFASVQVAPGTRPQTTRGPIYQPDPPIFVPSMGTVQIPFPVTAGVTSIMVLAPSHLAVGNMMAILNVDPAFGYEWDVAADRNWHIVPSGVTRLDVSNIDPIHGFNILVIYGIDG